MDGDGSVVGRRRWECDFGLDGVGVQGGVDLEFFSVDYGKWFGEEEGVDEHVVGLWTGEAGSNG